MFCSNCGKEVADGAKFCDHCGSKIVAASTFAQMKEEAAETAKNVAEEAKEQFNKAGDSIDSAVEEIANDFRGNKPAGSALKTDRSLVAFVLLSIITCGIYGYYFIYTVARDVNVALEDDDEETAGLGMFILLSFVTCGFYNIYWEYKLGNRLAKNAASYGLNIQENGTTIVLWKVLGALICFIGTFVGEHILIKNVNQICAAYNRKNGL